MDRSAMDNLANSNLFKENKPGNYQYVESSIGKHAQGTLELSDDITRNLTAQRKAGGSDREKGDDGGHLIGARFNGSPQSENIDAQNSNLNRKGYKSVETDWKSKLEDDKKVFVEITTFKSNKSERPDAIMGYSITESQDGSRDFNSFSFQNASLEEQEIWNNTIEKDELEDNYLIDNDLIDNDSEYSEDADIKEVLDGYDGDIN